MRTMMTARIPVEAGNKGIKDGSLPKIVQAGIEEMKPEAVYFGTSEGCRTVLAVFDLKDASDIPRIAEPFFIGLNAHVSFQPVMNGDDLKAGLGKVKM